MLEGGASRPGVISPQETVSRQGSINSTTSDRRVGGKMANVSRGSREERSYGSFEGLGAEGKGQLPAGDGLEVAYQPSFGSNWAKQDGHQLNLAFLDVSYTIPPPFFSKKKEKVILDSVR